MGTCLGAISHRARCVLTRVRREGACEPSVVAWAAPNCVSWVPVWVSHWLGTQQGVHFVSDRVCSKGVTCRCASTSNVTVFRYVACFVREVLESCPRLKVAEMRSHGES